MYEYILVVDGGARNNGTADSYGYGSCLITTPDGKKSKRVPFLFGSPATNNEAEYLSLIESLRHIIAAYGAVGETVERISLTIKMDSALVIGQLGMGWAVKASNLLPLFTSAANLLAKFKSFSFVKISGEEMKSILGH